MATYDDVLAAPEHLVVELIDGVLYTLPRPARRHGQATVALTSEAKIRHGQRGGPWVILIEPELWLGPPGDERGSVLVPDVAGWRRERYRVDDVHHGEVVRPDWVCEVVSPSTASHDRIRKMAIYAREQVPWAWLVDPIARTVEVYELVSGRWTVAATAEGDVTIDLPPFGTPFDLGAWWDLPPRETVG